MVTQRRPVTSDDLRQAAAISAASLREVIDQDWSVKAHNLRWSCRRTLEHTLNCLAWYAHDLANQIDIDEGAARENAPHASLANLIRSVETLAEVLAVVTDAMPPAARALHNWGTADPEGFRAMGTIEIILHTWDITRALDGRPANPAALADIAGRVLARLFPDAPAGHPPFATLLYVTGRGDLPGLPPVTRWRWHSAPLATG